MVESCLGLSLGPWEKGKYFSSRSGTEEWVGRRKEGAELDRGKRQADNEKGRKEKREEHHI